LPARVGVVTVLFNSDDVLPGFFQSLAAQSDVTYKLYVIDNSKTDSGSRLSRNLAGQYQIDCEVIFNDANVGVARGNNQGIDLALRGGCDHILLANNDIEFQDSRIIARMLGFMREARFEVAVPKIYYYGQDRKLWFAGGIFHRLRVATRHVGDREVDNGQYDQAGVTAYAPTCFMMLSSVVFSKVGKMREPYFVYYDDTDFLYRLAVNGIRVGYMPEAEIMHKVSYSTGGDDGEFALFYFFRNRILFLRYNYSFLRGAVSAVYVMAVALYKAFFHYKGGRRKAVLTGVLSGWKARLS
jgi:GT2 family glycosyltransferase